MATTTEPALDQPGSGRQADTMGLIAIALAVALVHFLTNNRYGFHRDELQTLSDALHLDWDSLPIRLSRLLSSALDSTYSDIGCQDCGCSP